MNILTLTTPDIENGLGCRVSLWFAGCSHKCYGCHNQHTWEYDKGENLLDLLVLDKIYKEVNHEYIDGITLTGGDPLCQTEKSLADLKAFLISFKDNFPDKNIWIYTGYTYEQIKVQGGLKYDILKMCDVLVDGEFHILETEDDLPFRGSTNQRIIDIQKSIKSNGIVLIDL